MWSPHLTPPYSSVIVRSALDARNRHAFRVTLDLDAGVARALSPACSSGLDCSTAASPPPPRSGDKKIAREIRDHLAAAIRHMNRFADHDRVPPEIVDPRNQVERHSRTERPLVPIPN